MKLSSQFKRVFSLMTLLALGACGGDANDTAEALRAGTFNVTRHGCSGTTLNVPAHSGVAIQMTFTETEMITRQTSSNGLNNGSNTYQNPNFTNNYNYGQYANATDERDLIRYVDKNTIEVVNRNTSQVDRLNVEFLNDDRNVRLSTHTQGALVGCAAGAQYIIELYRI